MKIGVSSYSFQNYLEKTGSDYFRICEIAKEIGFEAIEFIDLDLKFGKGEKTVKELALSLRSHCVGLGLALCAYTVHADFLNGSVGDPKAEAERVKACVDIAQALGAPVMRHDVTWKLENKGKSYRDAIRLAAPYIRDVAEYARGKGIRTCTENHGYLMQDAARVEELILAVNHENFGWLVDMGNFLCADEDSAYAVGIAAPYAFHVHAKDFLKKPGTEMNPGTGWFPSRGGNYLRGTVVGHGAVPVAQCVRILQKAGYDGFLSLEFEGMEENLEALKAGYAYLKRACGNMAG